MSRRRKPNSRNPSGSGRPTAGQLAVEMDSWLFESQEFRDALAADVFAEPGVKAAVERNLALEQDNTEKLLGSPSLHLQRATSDGLPAMTHIPSWLRLSIQETLLGLVTDETATCQCGPRALMTIPQTLLGAAWKPRALSCARHGGEMFQLAPRSTEAMTCDACGRVVTGAKDDPMLMGIIPWGELLFQFGTCADCKPDYAEPSP